MTITTGLNQTPDSIREDTALGRPRLYGTYLGIVKGNADPQRMGRLSVYIPDLGGSPDDETTWYVMSYASPFAGATNLDNNAKDGEGAKKMSGTQMSYGWWAVPPDVNNEVICCFINGDTARGVWFGCLYQQFMNHMVPAVGLNVSTDEEINQKNLPPVCEYNRKDKGQNIWDPKRPVFEPLHNGLVEQGLYNDPERGPASTGARRESPSNVYGFSTPRGNNIHIDDKEDNEFIRLRTRSGVQILIHETTGYIYMISKKGNSWFELSDEGINMYSKESISMRSEKNINLHSDNGTYSQATRGMHERTGNHTAAHESDSTTHVRNDRNTSVGGTASQHAATANRNSNSIADAANPQQPSTFNSNGSTNANNANGTTQAGTTPSGSGGGRTPSTPGSAAPMGSTSTPGGSASFRNNNPGNIMYGDFARSMGATGRDPTGHQNAVFPSYEAGRAAQENLLFERRTGLNYPSQSFNQMIQQYAPTSDGNNPAQYSAAIAAAGIDVNKPLGQYTTQERGILMTAMQKHEGWLGPRR